ncbi:MAG: N-acetylmuramoyl-L-alanine amidase [Calditrichaeota bacterium]|nr:MAG: N-acetylmuramoyl-L-alanine amidase [Calditrichota bacterium]
MSYRLFYAYLVIISATAVLADQPLFLKITFPQPIDTIDADRIRVSGYTEPKAKLTINEKIVPLYPRGSFVARVNLTEGVNNFIIHAQRGNEIAREYLSIYRLPVYKSYSPEPTKIDKNWSEPQKDVWLSTGDFLYVQFKGSPGGKAIFHIDKFEKNIPMAEIDSSQTDGVRGIYRGAVRISETIPVNKLIPITCELQGVDKHKQTILLSGKLLRLNDRIPLVGKTMNLVILQGSASRYLPIARLPENVQVTIIGRENDRFKIKLAQHRIGYIDAQDVKLMPWGNVPIRAAIGAPAISQDREWIYLSFPIDSRVPFIIEKDLAEERWDLNVFDAQQSSFWITYPNVETDIMQLTLNQPEENLFRCSIQLKQEQSWGFRAEYVEKSLKFCIRRHPSINPQSPLQNIIIAIDAGHGGEEKGAISPLGVLEKDINLAWACSLQQLLQRGNAKVVMTRESDETVSLQERVRRAESENAHLFISLHNNGVTASGNAAIAEGTSTYFTMPHSKELAWSIFPHLTRLGLAPYGRIYNSYFVTNTSSFVSALVEGGFLTNPQEEVRLANPEFQNQMANAVYNGIVDFLLQQAY